MNRENTHIYIYNACNVICCDFDLECNAVISFVVFKCIVFGLPTSLPCYVYAYVYICICIYIYICYALAHC